MMLVQQCWIRLNRPLRWFSTTVRSVLTVLPISNSAGDLWLSSGVDLYANSPRYGSVPLSIDLLINYNILYCLDSLLN